MNLELLRKTGEITFNGYYKQEVPFPDEKDKLLFLATLPKNIAKDFDKYSLEKLMLNIPFLAYYMPKYVGSIDDYVVKRLSPDEAREYLKIAEEVKSNLSL
jgi:hypothetical protein